jgi:uncharacterized protein
MWPVFPVSLTLAVMGAMFLLVFVAMRFVQPAWWRSRVARLLVLSTFAAMLVGVGLWSGGLVTSELRLVHLGAGVAYVGVLSLLPAAVMAPLAAGIDRLVCAFGRRTGEPPIAPPAVGRVTRRSLLRLSAASLPALAAAGGASGFAQARRSPRIRVVPMRYPDLHPDLDGFRILQLSDLHLGVCAGLQDLDRALRRVRAELRPDLIVLTGDLADDASLIPGALRLVASAGARYGALASLGNHEYLHDIAVTRPMYEASPVPLLVGSGRTLRIGGATLFVGGADDPVHMGGDIPWFLRPSIEAAATMAPSAADFRLLLCHRPEGFGPATDSGFDLTLAGHTHGGQIGALGRSLLESVRPGVGWWGSYRRRRPADHEGRQSHLYTTSGFGHWFPFRVGCPTEMPLIVLEREPHSQSALHRA